MGTFSVIAHCLWISLPSSPREVNELETFKMGLKLKLTFRQTFSHWLEESAPLNVLTGKWRYILDTANHNHHHYWKGILTGQLTWQKANGFIIRVASSPCIEISHAPDYSICALSTQALESGIRPKRALCGVPDVAFPWLCEHIHYGVFLISYCKQPLHWNNSCAWL